MAVKLMVLVNGVVASLSFMALPAAAAPLIGQISLGGYAQANGAIGMGGATGVSFANSSGSAVTGSSGTLTSYGAGSGSFSNFGACSSNTTGCGLIRDIASFAGVSTSGASNGIANFLSLSGPSVVSFDLSSISSVTRTQDSTGGSLTFSALGTIKAAGFDPTLSQFFFTAQGNNIVSYSATIVSSGVAAAVPEPASWAMMILGIGAVGYTLRRRQSVRVSYAA